MIYLAYNIGGCTMIKSFGKVAALKVLMIYALSALAGLAITIILTIIMSLSGLPTIMPVSIGILLHLILFIVAYAICHVLTLKILRKTGNNTKKNLSLLKKATIAILILSILFDIILGLAVGIGLGGDNYWHNQAAMIEQMMERIKEKKEKDKHDWGLDYIEDEDEKNWGTGSTEYSDEAQKLIEIALAEAKYYEENKLTSGRKYWQWLSGLGHGCSQYKHKGEYGWDWCATFVTWCVYQAGLASDSDPDVTFGDLLHKCSNVRSCNAWNSFMKGLGWECHSAKSGYEPKPGDIVLFYRGGSFGHIGIVEKYESGRLYTIEGNVSGVKGKAPYCFTSIVKHYTNRGVANGSLFYTPPYKKSESSNGPGMGSGSIAGFDTSKYAKDSKGYTTDLEGLLFDYFTVVKGYNTATTAGIMANVLSESGGRYDVIEYGYGKVYKDSSKTGDVFYSPKSGYNGNYVEVGDIEKAFKHAANFYTDKPIKVNGKQTHTYGMGYGIFQWSQGNRTSYYNLCKSKGLDFVGPNSILGQMEYLNVCVGNDSIAKKFIKDIYNQPNTAEGAYNCAGFFCHFYERPNGHSGKNGLSKNLSACKTCSYRANYAKELYEKYKNRKPTISLPDGNTQSAGAIDISNCTIIGDSNTVRMSSYGTTITKAKKVLATVGVGVGSWDTLSKDKAGSTTIPNLTLKQAIGKLSKDDLSHVVIMLGTNDFSSTQSSFTANYTSILDYIKSKNSSAIVTICTVPPVNDNKSSSIKNSNATTISSYIKSIASSYSGLKVVLLDVNSHLSSSDMSTSNNDGYHLSTKGATKCANYIASNCH